MNNMKPLPSGTQPESEFKQWKSPPLKLTVIFGFRRRRLNFQRVGAYRSLTWVKNKCLWLYQKHFSCSKMSFEEVIVSKYGIRTQHGAGPLMHLSPEWVRTGTAEHTRSSSWSVPELTTTVHQIKAARPRELCVWVHWALLIPAHIYTWQDTSSIA